MNVTLHHPSKSKPVEVQLRPVDARQGLFRYEVGQEKGELRVSFNPAGGVLQINGRVTPFHAVRTDGAVHVWLRGRLIKFELMDRTARRAGAAAAVATRDELTAPMPGTILKIKTAAGSSFKPHDPLIIMESMKMEMTLSVPHAGRVGAILCREGQLVEMGAVLARLEPDGDGSQTS